MMDDLWLADAARSGLNNSQTVRGGPGYYESKMLPVKESFNHGQVAAFGSSTFDRSRLKGSALMASNLEVPGPGFYEGAMMATQVSTPGEKRKLKATFQAMSRGRG